VGSPPSARGIPSLRIDLGSRLGITPERAGNTGGGGRGHSISEDHPRARGEYFVTPAAFCMSDGSPPSARGIHDTVKIRFWHIGITPERAGNTVAEGV